ncbi:hypothetical protein EDEG_03875 [Edhazardia aedis USNM 41457]|uniref:Yos1-like protein n=1 Tax=Edhazardia aedis (strain USNM 41457) TaxID=1003232 RepID=J9DG63_EDHAE|nr:hypothetical protein EDEG_03875 [Edhazardia aedis USNM 41457]|eukprot:EJW01570.1 hypothetical protein EDEG_03875 [Edhazardia aedis USNM 41457]
MFGIFKIIYAIVLFTNGVVILNDARFLSKVGLPLRPEARRSLGNTRGKIVDLISATKTVMMVPLVVLNSIFILYEIFFG